MWWRGSGWPGTLALLKTAESLGAVYRCSAGLVLDRTKTVERLNLVFAERDAATRSILKAQLDNEFPATETRTRTILNSAEDLSQAAVAVKGPLLALVDPFKIEDLDWDAIRQGLAGFIGQGSDAVIEVFTYSNSRDTVDWPPSPEGVSEPVAVLNEKPYHLAVYCTDRLRARVEKCCVAFGWHETGEPG